MATDPSASLTSLSDTALRRSHDRLHEIHKATSLGSEEIEAHHLIADELRRRGLGHPTDTDGLHDAAITMSSVRVPLENLAKMLGPAEVDAIAQMALANGTTFADVYELLTANGWALRAEPAMPSEDDTEEPEDGTETGGEVDEEYANLNPRQIALVEAYEKIAEDHGPFDQTASGNGAHYIPAADNVFASAGIKCSNCVFFHGGGVCEILTGQVEAEAACKLWVIDTGLVVKAHGVHKYEDPEDGEHCARCGQDRDNWRHKVADAKQAAALYKPPIGVQDAAKRALEWVREGYAGDGFTQVGIARARDLSNGKQVSPETVRRMYSFFARHGVNRDTKYELEDGKPTPWRVAWDAWGGDAGRTWAKRVVEGMKVGKAGVIKAVEERRFTLGPWYVPNSLDAHDEWTDPDELQAALWDYVKKGNREIRLQHTPNTRAGEWVEAMTLPFPMEAALVDPASGAVTRRTFPPGTVMLGVQWDDWAWEMVKKGQIRGYSIGGSAERADEEPPMYVDVTAE